MKYKNITVSIILLLFISISISGCGTTAGVLAMVSSSITYISNNGDDDTNGASTGLSLSSYLQQDLILWLDATSITGVNDGELLSLWNDKSVSANHAIDTYGQMPTYNTNVINGKPAVRFDTNDLLTLPGVIIPNDRAIIVILKFPLPPRVDGWNVLIDGGAGCTTPFSVDASGHFGAYRSGSFDSGFDFDPVTPGYHIAAVVSDSSTANYYFDGILVGSTATPLNLNPIVDLNNYGPSKQETLGDLTEMLIYKKELTGSERQEIEHYLDTKWGLNLGL